VTVGTVTGTWFAEVNGAFGVGEEPIVLVQNQASVTGSISTFNDNTRFASGTGSVSNPRSLTISLTFSEGAGSPFSVTYVGTFDDKLTTWTGTVTGYTGCLTTPCSFIATQSSSLADFRSRRSRRQASPSPPRD
jgi:hypothetical protein